MSTSSGEPDGDVPGTSISRDVAEIIAAVTELSMPFLGRQIAGDPAGEICKTRRLTQADLDSEPVRRARVRYWLAGGYVRLLVAHQLYPGRFEHPGPFGTPERLAEIDATYARFYGPRPQTFAARMAGDRPR